MMRYTRWGQTWTKQPRLQKKRLNYSKDAKFCILCLQRVVSSVSDVEDDLCCAWLSLIVDQSLRAERSNESNLTILC